MIVQCDNCSTKFNLPEDRIPQGGAKVKCSKCGNVFQVEPPPPAEPEDLGPEKEAPPGPGPEEEEDLFGDDFDKELEAAAGGGEEEAQEEQDDFMDFSMDDEEQGEEDEEEGDEEEDEDEEDEEFEEDEDEGEDLDDLGLDEEPATKGGSRKILVLLLLVILLGGLSAAGWYYKDAVLGMFLEQTAPANKSEAATTEESEAEPPVSPDEEVKGIGLQNVRQYYLDNEKAGQLFVVEGKAVNNFDTPKEMIKVQADLYDGKGNALASKTVTCGNTLSMYQLQVESPEAVEKALAAEVGILANNTYLKTGMSTPFMIVFFNPPPEVREFQVKVVAAEDAQE
jgi:predicted Zn finger-like uncharacterized protein